MIQQTLQYQNLPDVVHKPSRWITSAEQTTFISFLNHFGISEYTPRLKNCATQFAKYRCSKFPSHSKKGRYNFCGTRGVCPRCSKLYSYKKSLEMYQWIKVNLADKLSFDLKVNHMILTLPLEHSSTIDVKIFSRMIREFMGKMGIQAFGYSIHERHSARPLSIRFVHAHVLSLNIKEGRRGLAKHDYYFDPLVMRQNWKNVIKKFTGIEVEGEVNLKNCYASFFQKKQQVQNIFAYLYKYPVIDLFENIFKDNGYYLEVMHFDSPDSVAIDIRCMMKTKPRLIWCGLLTSAKRKLLSSLIFNSDWKDIASIRRTLSVRSRTCVDCGAWLESTPYEIISYNDDNEPRSVSSVSNSLQNFRLVMK